MVELIKSCPIKSSSNQKSKHTQWILNSTERRSSENASLLLSSRRRHRRLTKKEKPIGTPHPLLDLIIKWENNRRLSLISAAPIKIPLNTPNDWSVPRNSLPALYMQAYTMQLLCQYHLKTGIVEQSVPEIQPETAEQHFEHECLGHCRAKCIWPTLKFEEK